MSNVMMTPRYEMLNEVSHQEKEWDRNIGKFGSFASGRGHVTSHCPCDERMLISPCQICLVIQSSGLEMADIWFCIILSQNCTKGAVLGDELPDESDQGKVFPL